jgi:hypothetical protein
MSKYTKGEWKVVLESEGKHLMVDEESIMCNMAYYPWTPDNPADWDLIAQAPAMHKELEKIIAGFTDYPAIQRILDRVEGKNEQEQ